MAGVESLAVGRRVGEAVWRAMPIPVMGTLHEGGRRGV